MSKFPKSGQKEILGQIVTYELTESLDDGASLGECLFDKNLIRIDKSLRGEVRNSTILHEELEMINAKLDIGLEHKQINALETGLMSVKEVKP